MTSAIRQEAVSIDLRDTPLTDVAAAIEREIGIRIHVPSSDAFRRVSVTLVKATPDAMVDKLIKEIPGSKHAKIYRTGATGAPELMEVIIYSVDDTVASPVVQEEAVVSTEMQTNYTSGDSPDGIDDDGLGAFPSRFATDVADGDDIVDALERRGMPRSQADELAQRQKAVRNHFAELANGK